MYDGDLHETRAFLVALCACDGSVAPSSLTAQLARALQEDGYELQHTGNVIRSLRGLAESSERVDVIALVMVGVCILCAGLASGLTQVNESNHTLLNSRIHFCALPCCLSYAFSGYFPCTPWIWR